MKDPDTKIKTGEQNTIISQFASVKFPELPIETPFKMPLQDGGVALEAGKYELGAGSFKVTEHGKLVMGYSLELIPIKSGK